MAIFFLSLYKYIVHLSVLVSVRELLRSDQECPSLAAPRPRCPAISSGFQAGGGWKDGRTDLNMAHVVEKISH